MKVEFIQHKLISTGKASTLASGKARNEVELMCGAFPELSVPANWGRKGVGLNQC